tara:strand:+ start:1267 stop:1509 length:243 start_codon:yes stop_codon:yes gene_type:complete
MSEVRKRKNNGFKLRPYNYVCEKDTMIKTRLLGKALPPCVNCGLMQAVGNIGEPCGRCGTIVPDPNWEDGYDEWTGKRTI